MSKPLFIIIFLAYLANPIKTQAIYQYGAHYTYNAMTAVPHQANGASVTLDITKPKLSKDDYHVITELNVSSNMVNGSKIEVGYIVSNYFGMSPEPKLVVFNWIDGIPKCFNGCGYVQVSKNYRPGMNLTPNTKMHFKIIKEGTRWNVYVNNEVMGYYPMKLWNNKFTSINYMSAYGEIAGSKSQATSEMGNGRYGTSKKAARITDFMSIASKKPHHFNFSVIGQYGDKSCQIKIINPSCKEKCTMAYGGRYTKQ